MDILEGRFDCSLVKGTPTGKILKEIAEIWKLVGDKKEDIFSAYTPTGSARSSGPKSSYKQ